MRIAVQDYTKHISRSTMGTLCNPTPITIYYFFNSDKNLLNISRTLNQFQMIKNLISTFMHETATSTTVKIIMLMVSKHILKGKYKF